MESTSENGTGAPDSGEDVVHDLASISLRLEAHERLIRVAVDNTAALLQRTDPLTWTRRALVLGLSSALGSGLAASIVHTIWLAYFHH
jgi:hypothetical protein